jgi:hypothetical protein
MLYDAYICRKGMWLTIRIKCNADHVNLFRWSIVT